MIYTKVDGQMRLFSWRGDGWTLHTGRVGPGVILAAPIVEAWEKSGVSCSELSRRVYGDNKTLNTRRLRSQKRFSVSVATRIVKALDLTPADFGL
jgi:hypothetical protein